MEIGIVEELHLTKKDFKIDWYSGTGAGGQHRNKHQNCCRITHIESGLTSNGTSSRKRVDNEREAFINLAEKVIRYFYTKKEIKIIDLTEVVRNYNMKNNLVTDRKSGFKQSYKKVVTDGHINEMIDKRRESCL